MDSNMTRHCGLADIISAQEHGIVGGSDCEASRMRKVIAVLATAATIAAFAAPAEADGSRRRAWRGPAYAGAISRNVITPYYVGYYPGHYSYYAPDPVPYPAPRLCWFWDDGYPYRVC